MKVQVYGKGCARCHQLAENVEKALKEIGIEAQVEHVTDIKSITDKGIMFTPALVIDENIASEGKILTVEEAKKVIKEK
ncbi:MAG: thioredoxin family protein [Candidatus Omnitrophica bacterium]|nr:thioredoxin family protein [Candidatus Omnitrophota bacterium]MDD5355925.1 thioredoxin family protein [Candidatus Omnitrophota bacterium]